MADKGTNFLADYSKFLDSRSEHITYAALSVYRDFADDLSKKEEQFLKEHLSTCKICTLRLKELTDFEREGKQNRTKTILGLKPLVFRFAIAAIIVVSVGSVILMYLLNPPLNKHVLRSISKKQSLLAQSIDAERFVPNQVLENFVERTVRSSSAILILAPNIGDTITTPFTLKWERIKKGERYTLIVLDNKNAEVWKKTTSSSETLFEKTLKPGLYYVKLEVNEKLIQIGKFLIVR